MATLYLVHDWATGGKIIFTDEKVMEKFFADARNYDEDFVDDLEKEEIEVNFDVTKNIYKLYAFVELNDNSSYVFNTKVTLQNFIKNYGLEFYDDNDRFPEEDNGWEEYGDYKVFEFPQENEDNHINPTFDMYMKS